MSVTVRLQGSTEFSLTMRKYLAAARKDIQTECPRRALRISFGAIRNTHKADYSEIVSYWEAAKATVLQKIKSGKRWSKNKKLQKWFFGSFAGPPRLALAINKFRGEHSLPGLYGEKMLDAMRKVLNSKLRGIAWLRSGWLPCALYLMQRGIRPGPMGGTMDRETRSQTKKHKPGNCSISLFADKTRVVIWHESSPKNPRPLGLKMRYSEALAKWGPAGLSASFDEETADMKVYLARKLKESAQKLGIKTS